MMPTSVIVSVTAVMVLSVSVSLAQMIDPQNGCAMQLSNPGGPSAVAQWEYVDPSCANRQTINMIRSQQIPNPLFVPVGTLLISPDGCFVVNAIQCVNPECSNRGAITAIRLCMKPGDGYWTGK